MDNKKEIWKDVPGYEGFYKVSNTSKVKSVPRTAYYSDGRVYNYKERLLKPYNNKGYLLFNLCKNSTSRTFLIHQLVAMAFLDHKVDGHNLVVNHINFDKLDNRPENLEIITQRENTNLKHKKSSSKYTGVSWNKRNKKWVSIIYIEGKNKYLGQFKDEYQAHLAYKNELNKKQ